MRKSVSISGKAYPLTSESVDEISVRTVEVLKSGGMDKNNIVRLRLAVEDVLLKWRKALGEDSTVLLGVSRKLGRHVIRLSIKGPQINPFEITDSLDAAMAQLSGDDGDILENSGRAFISVLGLAPTYTYINGENRLSLMVKKKRRRPFVALFCSILAAIAVGFICRTLPSAAAALITDDVITPLFDTFMGFLSALSGPMMFLAVIWGIYSIGDVNTLGAIGKRLMSQLTLALTLCLLSAVAIALPFVRITLNGGGDGHGGFVGVYSLILDIIPDSFVAPFSDKNSLQIVFLAVIIGFAALLLNRKASVFAQFVEQSNAIVQLIMEVVSLMVPGVIFLSIVRMILTKSLSILTSGAKLIALLLSVTIAVLAVHILLLCLRTKASPIMVLKKLAPTFVIALSTASSSAAFATNMLSCERGLGIQRKLVNFGIPLGSVTFMPIYGIMLILSAICMAEAYDVPITPSWLLTLFLLAWILSIANPPIPGGGMACYTILFTQLGLPTEALAVVFTIETLADYVVTACDIATLQLELTYAADRLGMLDRDLLRKPVRN